MKLIHNFKSPNFNDRRSNNIEIIVIHYTALSSISNSLKYLCSKKNKVSSHYLISQSGKIYSLVSEKKRAWHAGQSYWRGIADINSISIGIELDYSPSDINNKYSFKLNSALIFLLKKLIKKYKIRTENILGHSDIAPYRKIDPGPTFPWYKMYDYNLIVNSNLEESKINYLKKTLEKNNIKSKKDIALFILSKIGYNTSKAKNEKKLFNKLILAYQSHYLQSNYTGKIDKKTMNCLIKHYLIIY